MEKMKQTAISVSHLKHNFGTKTVLSDITFQIKEGQIFGLLGPSGAGKTTIIKILTGQIRQTAGDAVLLGKNSSELQGSDYKNIGIMMDDFGLYERMSCYDNLMFFCKVYGVSTATIVEVLQKVGLGKAEKTIVSNLSKGMYNRMLLARSILCKPKVLFLDEPTSGLDPKTTEEIHQMILEMKKAGITIFLTTHNMAEAEKLCDNIALLNEGQIVEYGSPKEICRKYNHQKQMLMHLYDGTDIICGHDKEGISKVIGYLEKGMVETIHSTEPNLETVFIELTGRKFD